MQYQFDELKVDVDNEVNNLKAEEFLNKDNVITIRNDFSNRYIQLIAQITLLNQDIISLDDENIKQEYLKFLSPIEATFNTIKLNINKLFQLQFEYYLPPVDVNGKNIDLLKVNVERNNIDGNPSPTVFSYNIWISGGLKIDVSAGFFLTSLIDYEYETKDVEIVQGTATVTQKAIYLVNKNELDFGVGGMINISPRGGTWIKPSLSVGTLVTSAQKLQILAGGGLIFGKEERLIFHGGLTLGYRNQLSSQYKDDGSESYDLGSTATGPTRNAFATGYFVGISYNFGKVNKAKVPTKQPATDTQSDTEE